MNMEDQENRKKFWVYYIGGTLIHRKEIPL